MKSNSTPSHSLTVRVRSLIVLLLCLCMPLAMTAATDITVGSASEWKSKCKGKSGEYNLKLTADITISTSDGYFDEFYGTFDGQGHTITLNTSGEDWALIDEAPKGKTLTVKNLRLAGTQKVEQGTFSYDEQSPLIRQAYGTVNIENCQTEVTFTVSGTSGNYCYVGGFISQVNSSSTANFTNCQSSVTFNTKNGQDMGGFVGRVDSGGKVTATNCHSFLNFTYMTSYQDKGDIGYFVGERKGTLTCTNCYARMFYLSGDADTNPTEGYGSTPMDGLSAYGGYGSGYWSWTDWKTGEIAYKLNQKSSASDVAWLQTIGSDEIPQLRVLSPNSETVYYQAKKSFSGNEYGARAIYFPNDLYVSSKGAGYKVTGVKNGRLTVSHEGAETFHTYGSAYCNGKLIIYDGEKEESYVRMDAMYYNMVEDPDQNNIIKGNSFTSRTLKAGEYCFDPAQMKFVKGEGKTIGQWECYLSGDGLTADSYEVPLGPVPCSLTATTVESEGLAKGTVVEGTPTVTGLPSDYEGTITYSSSDTHIATVDSEGKVTYQGDGDANKVTITVTVPAFETWEARTLTYDINFKAYYDTFFGRELLRNGNFDDDITDWEVSGNGVSQRLSAYFGNEYFIKYFSMGYLGGKTITQTANLTTRFTTEELDASPKAYLQFDHYAYKGATTEKVTVEYLNADSTVISTQEYDMLALEGTPTEVEAFHTYQALMTVPSGTRMVRLSAQGAGKDDTDSRGGQAMVGFTNFSLVLREASVTVPTHKLTVTSALDGKTYGSGEYWEGSTVSIGMAHDAAPGLSYLPKHTCDNQFKGYAGETKPVISTTYRNVTIGTEDLTYEAQWFDPNTSALSAASVTADAIPYAIVAGLPTLTTPDDYTGTVTYSSGNTDVAMVNEKGVVSYVGTGKADESVTITLSLAHDGKYGSKTLTYDINFKASSQTAYGMELVRNGGFDMGYRQYSKWQIDGWTVADHRISYNMVSEDNVSGIGKHLAFGQVADTLTQTVNLSDRFTESELGDAKTAYLSFDYKCPRYLTSTSFVLHFLNAAGDTLRTDTCMKYTSETGEAPSSWRTVQQEIKVPDNVTAISIVVSGVASSIVKYYDVSGPSYDNISLKLQKANVDVKKYKVNVTADAATETPVGTGEYWEGSQVMIGTDHYLYGHECTDLFTGYDTDGDDIELSTTHRRITVSADQDYVAHFTPYVAPAFSETTFSVTDEDFEKFTEPTLGAYYDGKFDASIFEKCYKGTVTYASSNTDIAEVDSLTGKVTLKDAGVKSGSAVITATLSACNDWPAATADYTIHFGGRIDNPVTLSYTSVDAIANAGYSFDKPTFVGMPDDYIGTATYASGDTSIATVDEQGNVTYVGDGADTTLTITVTVPIDDTYRTKTLTYVINYHNNLTISSQEDWTTFVSNYSGRTVNATLECDLEVTDDNCMESFVGTLDAQGHTLTLSLKDKALFSYAKGTIKNLHLCGKINSVTDYQYFDGPVAMVKSGETLAMENCQSSITVENNNRRGTYWATGFVRSVYGNVSFNDCSFIGNMQSNGLGMYNVAGFVSDACAGSSVTLTNCLSDFGGSVFTLSYGNGDYFVYTENGGATITATNCYARQFRYNNGDSELTNNANATVLTDQEATRGVAAYKLNNGRKGDDAVWMQTIGTDAKAQLRTFSDESLALNAGAIWYAIYYPADLELTKGTKAYRVKGIEDGTIILEEKDSTYMQPVILYNEDFIGRVGKPDGYYNKVIPDGILKGVYEDTDAEADWYVLEVADGAPTFVKSSNSISQWECYLSDETLTGETLSVKVGSETGIDAVHADRVNDGKIYNLSGQRVNTMRKGQVYIINGKKVRVTK